MSSLSKELCALRKERKLSIQDIYEKTRIDIQTIEAVEDGSIFEHHEKGKPYLRSFIRTYAKALGIADDDIVKALDDQEIGSYDGLISKKYLKQPVPGEPSPKSSAVDDQNEGERPKLSTRRGSAPGASAKDSSKSGKKSASEGEIEKKDQQVKRTPATSSIDIPDEMDKPDPNREHNQTITDRPNVTNVDWANTVRKAEPVGKKPMMPVGIAATVIVILGIGSAIYFGSGALGSLGSTLSDVTDTSEPADTEVPDTEGIPSLPDTLVDNDEPEQQQEETEELSEAEAPGFTETAETAEPETLPDTLQLILHGADGVLEPVRVRSDADHTLRPYWVEEGQGIAINFVDEIQFTGNFNRMGVMFNGHPVDEFMDYLNEDGFVVLTRSLFQEDAIFTQPASEDQYQDYNFPADVIEPDLD